MPPTTTANDARPRPVFVLGMMGAGKSRVGRELADMTGAVFIDHDARIELMFGRSIPELFELGEPYFRACERSALVALCREPGFAGSRVVVATGGGILGDRANLETMAAVGDRVYLEVGVETLVARLSAPAEQRRRPLLADQSEGLESRVSALLEARAQDYRSAGHRVDAERSPSTVASDIVALLGLPSPTLPLDHGPR